MNETSLTVIKYVNLAVATITMTLLLVYLSIYVRTNDPATTLAVSLIALIVIFAMFAINANVLTYEARKTMPIENENDWMSKQRQEKIIESHLAVSFVATMFVSFAMCCFFQKEDTLSQKQVTLYDNATQPNVIATYKDSIAAPLTLYNDGAKTTISLSEFIVKVKGDESKPIVSVKKITTTKHHSWFFLHNDTKDVAVVIQHADKTTEQKALDKTAESIKNKLND